MPDIRNKNIKKILLERIGKTPKPVFFKFSKEEDIDLAASILKDETSGIFVFDPDGLTNQKALETAKKLRQLASIYNKIFIIKDRVDLVLLVDADGIHLDKNSYPFEAVKKLISNDKFFGITLQDKKDSFSNTNLKDFDYIVYENMK